MGISIIVTIILVPKLQPIVSEYIESEFVNNVGIRYISIYYYFIFNIVVGKALSRAVTWTGVGSIDKHLVYCLDFLKGTSFQCVYFQY